MTPLDIVVAGLGAMGCGICVALLIHHVTPYWDFLAKKHLGTRIQRMQQLGASLWQIHVGLRLWGLATTATFAVFWWGLKMPPVALAAAWLVYSSAGCIVDMLIERRVRLVRDQMVSTCHSLACAVKGHLSLPAGLESILLETPIPLRNTLQRIVFEFQSGRPLENAIAAAQEQLQVESFSLFATTLRIAIRQGGRVHEALVKISRCLQEHQRLERKIESETASGRRTLQILAVLPLGFVLIMQIGAADQMERVYTHLYGQVALATAMMMDYFGVRMAARMVRIKI